MADKNTKSPRLDQPKQRRGFRWPRFSQDAFGLAAERFARFMGTGAFLVYMTGFIAVWITLNILGATRWAWDPFPFILLNLCFSVQASYAAPLILLAQNRQADRDRVQAEQDRQRAERNLSDTEFLAREIAALRIALSEVATRDFVRSELRSLLEDLSDLEQRPESGDDERPVNSSI